MKQYFDSKTGKEVFLNKPYGISIKENGYVTSFSTSQLTESMADMLVSNGILTYKCPHKIHTEFDYYVAKLAKKLNITIENCCSMIDSLLSYAPATVFSLLAKQVALELDAKYEGHIGKSKELFAIELTTGYIIPIKITENSHLKNIALFRSVDDALFAINVLKPVYVRMFE
jgi:hypothetical protein